MRTVRVTQGFAFAVLATATWVLSSRLDPGAVRPYDVGFVPSAGTLRWLSLGHPTLAANLLWLRAVQYIGDPRGDARGWDKLYPLVDTVTDLDPGHGYAYQVAGTLLPSSGQVSESNAILEKGAKALPDRYILSFLRSFNAFYYDDDWAAAGHFAEIAAQAKDAPPHVRHYVLAFYVKGQRADAAVAFLKQALREAHDPETRKAVESQLQQAVLERDAAGIDKAIRAWRGRYVIGPLLLDQLVGDRLLESIPPDPSGGELYVDFDGIVRSTTNPFRFSKPEPKWMRLPAPARGTSERAP